MAGRRPKSAKEKRRAGNPGKRPIPHAPELPSEIPPAPARLQQFPRALEEWNRITPLMRRFDMITPLDADIIAERCIRTARAEFLGELAGKIFNLLPVKGKTRNAAIEFAEEQGLLISFLTAKGIPVLEINPALNLALTLEDQALKQAKEARMDMGETGGTPSARRKLGTQGLPTVGSEADVERKWGAALDGEN